MMALSNDIVSQFAKLTNDNKSENKENVAYGTIIISDGKKYVRLDGSNIDTPISLTTSAKHNDRVMVMIKNHEAIVTGNITSPSASQDSVDDLDGKADELSSQVSKFGIIVSYKITTEDIDAINANFEAMKAITGKFQELSSVTAEIETLKAKFASLEYIDSEEAKIINAEIVNLKAQLGEFSGISTQDLEAFDAEIVNLTARVGNFSYVSTEVLSALKAHIISLETDKLSAEQADLKYANIDFANINEAAIKKIFSDSGIIKDLIVSEGKITGELVGVTIKGDLIEGNTVKADKLVVKGSDGLYYKLNFEGGTFKEGEAIPEDGLHGSVIVAKSITAEKISVNDLVAFGATIGGFHIEENSLYSGVKNSPTNTTRGVYLDSSGQFSTGDSNNFIRYYKDQNGDYKLEISAKSILIGAGNKSVETIVNDAYNKAVTAIDAAKDSNDKVDGIEIGGRNLLIRTKDLSGIGRSWLNGSNGVTVNNDEEFTYAILNKDSEYSGSDKFTRWVQSSRYPLKKEDILGKDVVLSFETKSNTNINPTKSNIAVEFVLCNDSSITRLKYKIIYHVVSISNDWQRFVQKVKLSEDFFTSGNGTVDETTRFWVRVYFEKNNEYYFRKPKLEFGNKATDWTPAPEDMATTDEVKEVYKKADNAEKQITIQSATEPPTTTCMWLDTGVEPPMLKRYNSETSSWEPINDTSSINSSIAALEKHMYAEIAQTKESITSTVAQKYYLKEDAEKLASDISTQFVQTSEGFEMKFNQFNAGLEGLAKGTDAEFEEIRKHIRFINGKILLGEVGNQLELEISNNMISFIQSGVPVAWFTDNKLYVKDGEFTNSLRLGNFTYLPRSNGNLSFKKI